MTGNDRKWKNKEELEREGHENGSTTRAGARKGERGGDKERKSNLNEKNYANVMRRCEGLTK